MADRQHTTNVVFRVLDVDDLLEDIRQALG